MELMIAPHRTRVVDRYLEGSHVLRLGSPGPCSASQNPQNLHGVLHKQRTQIPTFDTHWSSIQCYCEACIAASGDHIRLFVTGLFAAADIFLRILRIDHFVA